MTKDDLFGNYSDTTDYTAWDAIFFIIVIVVILYLF